MGWWIYGTTGMVEPLVNKEMEKGIKTLHIMTTMTTAKPTPTKALYIPTSTLFPLTPSYPSPSYSPPTPLS